MIKPVMLVLKLLVLTAGVYCVHPDPVLKYKLGKKTSTGLPTKVETVSTT